MKNSAYRNGFKACEIGCVLVSLEACSPVRDLLEEMEGFGRNKDNVITNISLAPIEGIRARSTGSNLALILSPKSLPEFDEL